MSKPERFQPPKPSQLSAQERLKKQSQFQLRAVQPKMAAAAPKPPQAPPVYRPQPVPRVLQGKMAQGLASTAPAQKQPQAPPAYRPQPQPKVLQTKMAGAQPSTKGQSTKAQPPNAAPHIYRPEAKRIVQPKMGATIQRQERGGNASATRVQSVPGIIHSNAPRHGAFASNQAGRQMNAHKAPGVVQRVTSVRIQQDDTLNSTDVLVGFNHNRAAVHQGAKNSALQLGPWAQVPNGSVCNHSISYDRLQIAIEEHMRNETLEDAAGLLLGLYAAYAAPGDRDQQAEGILNQFGQGMAVSIARDDINRAFNYYLLKVCDTPANLFYWPTKTGGDPDFPTPINGPLPPGWVPKNPLAFDATGAGEIARLQLGAQHLQGTIDP